MALITPSQRLAALHSAKTLLTGEESTILFMKTSPPAPKPAPMIRIAEYILTGVDYRDTTPESASDIHGHNGLEEDADDDPAVVPPLVVTREQYEKGNYTIDDNGILILPDEKVEDARRPKDDTPAEAPPLVLHHNLPGTNQ